MLLEAALVYAVVLASIKTLYEFRSVTWIGEHLSSLTAAILLYVPFFLTARKHSRISLLGPGGLAHSLRLFAWTSLFIFPPFLLLSHFYQTGIGLHLGLHGYGWQTLPSASFLLTQILLIALPEEYFFRGYLQPVLVRRFSKQLSITHTLSIPLGVAVTAFFFALAHSVIHLQWWHFAIFFPALVFGWLKERTGGLVAGILFHALSNCVVQWISTSYR